MGRRLHLLLAIVFIYFTQLTLSTFVDSQICDLNDAVFNLRPFITDVAMDQHEKKLRFLINSQVINYFGNNSDTSPAFTDLNSTTGFYTKLRVKVSYMGRQIIDETKNFCDFVAVKDTVEYRKGPRFETNLNNHTSNTTSIYPNHNTTLSNSTHNITAGNSTYNTTTQHKGIIPRLRAQNTYSNNSLIGHFNDTTLGSSNLTISQLFSNSTGALVQCPLYYNDSILLLYDVDISKHFHRLGSYQVHFTVYDNNYSQDVLACSKSYITLIQPDFIDAVINAGVLSLLVITVFVNVFTVACSSYQESTNPYLFKASTICNAKLLKQGDASLSGIITYLQYAFFLGGLDLKYPGFYQPMIGQISWCALIDFILVQDSPFGHMLQSDDGVYITLSTGGLTSLTQYNSRARIKDTWPNFMADLGMVICLSIVVRQLLMFSKRYLDEALKSHYHKSLVKNPSAFVFFSRKNLYLIVGQILQIWLSIFAMPYLVLTLFMFLAATDLNGKHRSFSDYHDLKVGALSFTTSYNKLRIPHKLFSFGETFASPWGNYLQFGNGTATSGTIFGKRDESNTSSAIATTSSTWQDPSKSVLGSYSSESIFNNTDTSQNHHGNDYLTISNGSLSVSSILLAVWLGLVLFFIFNYLVSFYGKWKVKTSSKVSRLYTNLKTILIWSFLYHKYKPQRVSYVIFDFAIMFINSIVIGVLQSSGVAQVTCLIITSVAELIALFTLKPYFVPVAPWSSHFILPVARLLCTVLCIPFIASVNASESVKTYVAYIQLLVHTVVVLIFITQLVYWLIRTCISIHKTRLNTHPVIQQLNVVNSQDEFERQFEYKAIVSPFNQMRRQFTHESHANSIWALYGGANNNNNNNNNDTSSSIGEEEFLFRGRGTRLVANHNEMSNDIIYSHDSPTATAFSSTSDANSIQSSFVQQMKESELRKLKNDYRVREIDQVYEKYFVNDEIDPEVKELWENRKLANGIFHEAYCSSSTGNSYGNRYTRNNNNNYNEYNKEGKSSSAFAMKLRNIVNKQQPKPMEPAFVVSRPRPLIVKTLDEVKQKQQKQQSRQSPEHTASDPSEKDTTDPSTDDLNGN